MVIFPDCLLFEPFYCIVSWYVSLHNSIMPAFYCKFVSLQKKTGFNRDQCKVYSSHACVVLAKFCTATIVKHNVLVGYFYVLDRFSSFVVFVATPIFTMWIHFSYFLSLNLVSCKSIISSPC